MSGELSKSALARFKKTGFVVLENVFPASFMSALQKAVEQRYSHLRFQVALGDTEDARASLGHTINSSFIIMKPQPETSVLSDRVLNHPRVSKVAAQILNSDDFYIPIFDVVFNLPGKKAQYPHRDFAPILPGEAALPTTALCITIALVDTDETNGSLQLWPETQNLVDNRLSFSDDLQSKVKGRSSVQPKLKAGSVLIRDSRIIHRGMPNHSSTIRPWMTFLAIHPLIRFPNKLTLTAQTFDGLKAQTRSRLRYCETR